MYIIINLENVINNIEIFQKVLRKKSNIPHISFNASKIKKTDNSKYLKDNHYPYLKNYFSETRLKQFDFLLSNLQLF